MAVGELHGMAVRYISGDGGNKIPRVIITLAGQRAGMCQEGINFKKNGCVKTIEKTTPIIANITPHTNSLILPS